MAGDIDQRFLVIDASVVLAAIFPQEAYKDQALTFFERNTRDAKQCIAPSILLYEVFNAIRSAIVAKRITSDEAQVILSAYKAIEPSYIDFSVISQIALRTALSYDCSIYDAAYVAVSHHYHCSMYTLDKKLIQKLKSVEVNVLTIV